MTDLKRKKEYIENIINEPYDVMGFIRQSELVRDDICPSVGKEIGSFLHFLVLATNSKKIVEVGTSIGYSTSWLAIAAKKNGGHVNTIEIAERLINEAKVNIKLMNLSEIVTFHHGLGEKIIQNFDEPVDFIFIDGATKSYDQLFEISINKLKSGGLLVFEDVLFSVSGKREIQKEMMNEFNIKLKNDNRVETSFIGLGDGLLLCYKR